MAHGDNWRELALASLENAQSAAGVSNAVKWGTFNKLQGLKEDSAPMTMPFEQKTFNAHDLIDFAGKHCLLNPRT